MARMRFDRLGDGSYFVVITFVTLAVLALGYHFRAELSALSEQDYSGVTSFASPVSAALTDLTGGALVRAEQSATRLPGGEDHSPTSATHTEQAATAKLPAPVTIGYYFALSDTPVRAAPTSHAETVAFVYQGQRFLVVRSSGHYVEIRSISRDRQNPPGFVLRGDVKSMKEVEPHMLVSVRRALDE